MKKNNDPAHWSNRLDRAVRNFGEGMEIVVALVVFIMTIGAAISVVLLFIYQIGKKLFEP